jgi:hypothetical protein
MSHILSEYQKQTKVEISRALRRTRVYFTFDHELICLAQGQEILECERDMIQSSKMMMMIIWNPTVFDVIDLLSNSNKFNNRHYVFAILQYLTDWHISEIEVTNRELIMHVDNTWFHMAKLLLVFIKPNEFERVPHPPYSSDLAISYFSLRLY